MCTGSLPLIKLADEYQAEGKIPANPRACEAGGTSESGQFTGREAVQNGVPEMAADQAVAGERREHADSEARKPVALDIGDQHRPLREAGKCLK